MENFIFCAVFFVKMINGSKLLTIFATASISPYSVQMRENVD